VKRDFKVKGKNDVDFGIGKTLGPRGKLRTEPTEIGVFASVANGRYRNFRERVCDKKKNKSAPLVGKSVWGRQGVFLGNGGWVMN